MVRTAAIPAPAGRKYWVTEEMIDAQDWHRRQQPEFSVHEVAKVFFAMSASWLRLKLQRSEDHPETWFVAGGERMEFRRRAPLCPLCRGRRALIPARLPALLEDKKITRAEYRQLNAKINLSEPLDCPRCEGTGKAPAEGSKVDTARFFTLDQIEPMAWSLYDFAAIDAEKLATIVQLVIAEGKLYGLL